MNPKNWQWQDSGIHSARFHMAEDHRLLEENGVPRSHLLGRWYRWRNPCATFGNRQDPLLVEQLLGLNFEVARRPTGGGICLHQPQDLALTLFAPRGRFDISIIKKWRENLCAAFQEACGAMRPPPGDSRSPWCSKRFIEGELVNCGRKVLSLSAAASRWGYLLQANLHDVACERERQLRNVVTELIQAL